LAAPLTTLYSSKAMPLNERQKYNKTLRIARRC